MDIVVEARKLTKAYGSFVAVKEIDFTVRRQECFGFLGPNGAGKTSTMKMIYCRTPVTGGSLSVLGMDVRHDERRVKHQIGVVTQENDLDPDLTVLLGDFSGGHHFVTGPVMPEQWAEALSVPVERLGRLLVVEDALLSCFARWPKGA